MHHSTVENLQQQHKHTLMFLESSQVQLRESVSVVHVVWACGYLSLGS